MSIRTAQAVWEGTVKEGKGNISIPKNSINEKYSYSSRFEESPGSSPEELLAAAEASCFSMALTEQLAKEGLKPKFVDTTAKVHVDKSGEKFKITEIELDTKGNVPGIDLKKFQDYAEQAKKISPISQSLSNVQIKLNANLLN